jgi:hypothetical protein
MVRGSIRVDPYAPVLSKRNKDKVRWKGSPANLPFMVCFGDRSPFKNKHFYKARSDSGPIRIRPCGPEEYFKYSVEVGDTVLDPGIIIIP